MATAKKQRTPEEQAKIDARMAKLRAAKAQKANQNQNPQPQTEVTQPRDPGNPQEPSLEDLQRVVLETLQNVFGGAVPQAKPADATLTDRGIVGTKERYPVDPALYPNPTERISHEPRLEPVAFRYNYELDYKCNPTKRYQTQDGVWFIEPQFTLELNRIVRDELTGEATNRRYTICRGVFFEDPDTAIQMAYDMGVPVPSDDQFDFLNEMRYIRMRDWVFEAFFQPLDTSPKSNKREVVIDGRLVEMFEVNGEDAQTIPFNQIRNKLKA